ncbi:hypothetical protein MF271_01140 (plasmid) [Deinococcus sp. KNUC1210]|uniref:hypothetical protein n=1 Tax=Deinococcus sp. KNUC1210 TaxID=2917691 RepID=UPI001EF0121E|nr:hypothetical protein [Deinococcus sp. KNUC1210]ULH13965.1 hypothetical protein MF271_01140 [Deinococcus sp. KNUC1210]
MRGLRESSVFIHSDLTDEPASVLLERIRAQWAETGAAPKRGRKLDAAGKPPKQAGHTTAKGDTSAPKWHARLPKAALEMAAVPSANSYQEPVRQREECNLEGASVVSPDLLKTRATGTRQVALFGEEVES